MNNLIKKLELWEYSVKLQKTDRDSLNEILAGEKAKSSAGKACDNCSGTGYMRGTDKPDPVMRRALELACKEFICCENCPIFNENEKICSNETPLKACPRRLEVYFIEKARREDEISD